ncbi:phosphate acyltransferase [uncultured Desulfobacter sp.]|uniref:phosphate acyltransferase n=1 Tax=uncultured Desulfobacter sp. TaxID=240139 RepID=UPI0029F4BF4B|nr:phosphate acyltransferase [uncultured Desulfobacter sp.]
MSAELRNKIIEAVGEIGKINISMSAFERDLTVTSEAWLADLSEQIKQGMATSDARLMQSDISAIIEVLLKSPPSPGINTIVGNALSMMLEMERSSQEKSPALQRLLGPSLAREAQREEMKFLLLNPGTVSTRIAVYQGVEEIHRFEIHVLPDEEDSIDRRTKAVATHLDRAGIALDSFDGIACQGGFLRPIPSGTYRVVPEMLKDLVEKPLRSHASNMGIPMGMELARMAGSQKDPLLTTTDPFVCDELDLVDRVTGFVRIKRNGAGAHYLSHKAAWRIVASLMNQTPEHVNAVTAHLGGGTSLAAHRQGRVSMLIDAYSGLPSTSRSGAIDIDRVLKAIKSKDISIRDLEQVIDSRGGLLSLVGTNDFYAMIGFLRQGSTPVQRKKIELVQNFMARKIAGGMLKLTADGADVRVMAITGGLAKNPDMMHRVKQNIAGRYPVVIMPGYFEHDALAAGQIRGYFAPESLKDYETERDALAKKRHDEDTLIDTPVFKREIRFKKKGAPLTTLDDIIDAAYLTVEENYAPTIAIVGASNEEAIQAAKRANEEGQFRISKFVLLGDFQEISQMAYEYDLVIDNDNYTIIDTETPVEEAVSLLDQGKVDILMKGRIHTEDILRGVFKYLKASGRLQKGQVMSHTAIVDIPTRNKLLAFSDGALNTYPDEEKRVAILENALKVVHNLNIKVPKVAVISAVENVNRSVDSSIEAERIAARFADRDDCIVEGPLSLDVAMDLSIAEEKHYSGRIRGNADVLILPDIDSGNVLWKTLTTQSGAALAGVILCGDMPLILTSRGDSIRSKLASLSLAVKFYFDLKNETKETSL